MAEVNETLTAVPGVLVGHWTHAEAGTGCTVVLCPTGAVAGVDVRGGAPGTRETALLSAACMVDRIHAVLLAGGSAFGLSAADGVMRWLEERGIGFDTGVARVPIIPAAVLFDLPLGRADVRPDASAGYAACDAASSAPVLQGNIGAGTGASAGKWLGFANATKTGLGSAALHLPGGVVVAALVAVNALGNVVDPSTRRTIAGARDPADGRFVSPLEQWKRGPFDAMAFSALQNTTLAVVATNAALTKPMAQRVAIMAHDGLARTINPVHTLLDGDVVFVLSLGDSPSKGDVSADVNVIGALAAEVLAQAVLNAALQAEDAYGLPCAASARKAMRGQD